MMSLCLQSLHFENAWGTLEGFKLIADEKNGEFSDIVLLTMLFKIVSLTLVCHSKRLSSSEVYIINYYPTVLIVKSVVICVLCNDAGYGAVRGVRGIN